jgi:serine protease SohB
MACIADTLYAAPFAILGSIGVLAQIPNFNRVLKKYDVDYDILTAGEHKQSMTMFGENTEKMKQKLRDDLEDTHELFKSFVSQRRPQIDIGKVATGEIWYGQRAIDERLVDGLLTSDSYLQDQVASADVYRVIYHEHQSLQQKIGDMMHHVADKTFLTVLSRNQENQHSRY